MIKLTTYRGKTIWINANHIISIQEDISSKEMLDQSHQSFITHTGSMGGVHIKETVQQVMEQLQNNLTISRPYLKSGLVYGQIK